MPAWVARYLRLLGAGGEKPSRPFLDALVAAQLCRVPFENVSKIYLGRVLGRRRLPTIEEHLDGVEHSGFGGTCYANNPHFQRLLAALGFDADLCGAEMESAPDVHTGIRVRIDGLELLVDVGYGAPFFAPIDLGLAETQDFVWGNEIYVVHPKGADGSTRIDHLRDGERIHGFIARPPARRLADFERVIAESYQDTAMFMSRIRFVRYWADRSVAVSGMHLIRSTPSRTEAHALSSAHELVEAIEIGLGVPSPIARLAVSSLGELRP